MTEARQKKEEIQRACDQLAAQLKEEVDVIGAPDSLIPSSERYHSVASLATEMGSLRTMSEASSKRTKEMHHFESLCVQPVKFKFPRRKTEYVLRRTIDGFHIELNGKKIYQVDDDDEVGFKRPWPGSHMIEGEFTFKKRNVMVRLNLERDDGLSVLV